MATGIASWSQTAATNATADSAVNFAEGMAPSAVNDSARGLMSSGAKYRDDTAGTLTTGGTSTAYTLTSNQSFASLTALNGMELTVRFNATNGAAPTLAVDSLTAKPIQVSSTVAVGTGVILLNSIWSVTYDNSAGAFILRGVPASVQDSTVNTASIAANAVTLAKLATQADQTILGNVSGGSAVPSALTIGAGLTGASGTLKSAFPPPAAFKNLSIKVASNTTVTVAADFVATTNGTTYQTTAVSSTVNLGTSVAVDALDIGTIAIDSWYYIWVIAKADGTTKCVASLQSTANATFLSNLAAIASGAYTYYARIGAVRTIHASATLYGTWQLGRRAQYVVGLAQTTSIPNLVGGIAASTFSLTSPTLVSISLAPLVPSTASVVTVNASSKWAGGVTSNVLVAPSQAYSGANNGPQGSNAMSYPVYINGGAASSQIGSIVLEALSLSYASDGSGGAVCVAGWDDNI